MNDIAGKISDAELDVMRALWEHNEPVPLMALERILAERRGWKESTVKTLVRSLCAKGAAKLVSRGFYAAVVTETEYAEWSTHNLLGKVFEGSAKKLVAALLSDGQLTSEDIAELSAMFNVGRKHE